MNKPIAVIYRNDIPVHQFADEKQAYQYIPILKEVDRKNKVITSYSVRLCSNNKKLSTGK